MVVSVVFTLIIFPMHDEMDANSLEKDIIIQSHLNSFIEHKVKKFNLDAGTFLIRLLQGWHHEPELQKTLFIIPSLSPVNSSSSTILRL
jgi:hypothetical protein